MRSSPGLPPAPDPVRSSCAIPSASRYRQPAAALLGLLLAGPCLGQELEPRRWGHLPTGTDYLGIGYVYTEGEIAFDPVLRLEQGEIEMSTLAAKYIHSFEMGGRSARFDLVQAYQDGRWNGLLDGSPASVDRSGWGDTAIRFAVNLFGAPPLKGKEFAAYRAATDCETIIGAGLVATLPTGEYFDDKLINLGENRFSFRPQLGIVHTRGHWTGEFTGSVWLYTDNQDFWNGHQLDQDPLASMQGHLIYTIRPGLWLGTSLGYDYGGRSSIDGIQKDDLKSVVSWGLTCGVSVSRSMGFKFGYIGSRTQRDVGADLNHLVAAFSVMW